MQLDESEKKKTILLVEDEGIIALNVQERLSKMGFRVPLFVSTGEAAIREAEKLSPDLVLLDIRLAGLMSGIEAAQIIRERFDIPVVFMTSHSDHMTIRDSLTAFPYGYILKPVKDADLLTMIGSALARKELEVRVKNQERELIHTDRLASLGRLIAGVAHELSNPNQAILFHVEIVEQIAKDILSACDGEAERINLSSVWP
jgi:DNA-binding NtrC family response regulator